MSIEYTYEIISVDAAAKCMEVVYSADGRQDMHVGVRLPFEGESLEAVIDSFSPVPYWLEQDMSVVVPAVGTTGRITPAAEVVADAEQGDDTIYPIDAM